MTPINKQASIFLSKRRIDTIQQAMERFACKLTSPDVAQQIKHMLSVHEKGQEVSLKISVRIHRDNRTPDCWTVKLNSEFYNQLDEEDYYGVK